MPIHSFLRRSRRPVLGLLALGLASAGPLQASSIDPILGYNVAPVQPSLELGNGNKVAVGKFNHVHAVLANVDSQAVPPISDIVYEHFDPTIQAAGSPTASNPSQWDDYQLTTNGTSYLPAFALDTDGRAVVAWVSKPTPTSALGSIWYRYQTGLNCASCWSGPQQIVYYGTEPSITAENGTVYLAWTTLDRVQFTSFPKGSAPATPLWLGDVVDFTNCPGSKFRQPSIAFAHVPCDPLSLKIAVLFAANEQSSGGSCHDAITHVGPRVYERDDTTTAWSEVAFTPSPLASSSAGSQPDPTAISLSFNASRLSGDFFLAWSDELVSGKRTWLGHGKGTAWDFTPLDNLGHHVHVAAKSSAGADFRLAVSDQQGWSTGAYTETGKWTGGSLSWTGAAITIPAGIYGHVQHPQALYWSRCVSHLFQEMKTYTEADDYLFDPLSSVATDLAAPVSSSCPILTGPVVMVPPCLLTHISISHLAPAGGGDAVLVDLGDAAVITSLDKSGATLAALGGGTIQVTWEPGDVLAAWDNGFMIATRHESIRFASYDRASFDVEDLGGTGGSTGGSAGAK
jgi:hypothetical protein